MDVSIRHGVLIQKCSALGSANTVQRSPGMVWAELADRPRLGQSEMDFSGWLGSSQTCHSWFGLKKAPARLALLRNPWPGPQNHDHPCFPRFPLICSTKHVNSHFLESFAKLNSIEPEWKINLFITGTSSMENGGKFLML